MRYSIFAILWLCAVGCAGKARVAPVESAQPAAYTEAPAAALVFEPPLARGVAHPELARGPRQPSALLGFEESTTESYFTATYDWQSNDFGDFYVRQSFSVKSASRTR